MATKQHSREAWFLTIVKQEFVRIAGDTRRLASYRRTCRDVIVPELEKMIDRAEADQPHERR